MINNVFKINLVFKLHQNTRRNFVAFDSNIFSICMELSLEGYNVTHVISSVIFVTKIYKTSLPELKIVPTSVLSKVQSFLSFV